MESGSRTAAGVAYDLLTRVFGTGSRSDLSRAFLKEFGTDPTFEGVLRAFGNSRAERSRLLFKYFADMEPSEGYRLLAALLRAGYLNPIVLTTNFDCMLEKALAAIPGDAPRTKVRIVVGADVTGTETVADDEILIVKLHGDITRPNTLRTTSIELAVLPGKSVDLVRDLYERHGFLVIGYRGVDAGVQAALVGAKAPSNSTFWVSKASTPEITSSTFLLDLIRKQDALGGIFDEITFDAFMTGVAGSLPMVQERRRREARIAGVWQLLDDARSFGARRPDNLAQALAEVTALQAEVDLPEIDAQLEVLRFEQDRNGEAYRLVQAVDYLAVASGMYSGWMSQIEVAPVEIAYLSISLDLINISWENRTNSISKLDEIAEHGNRLHSDIPRSHILLKAAAGAIAADALVQRAMLSDDPVLHRSSYQQARNICTVVAQTLRSETSAAAAHTLAKIYWHLSVSYELEGDDSTNEDLRQRCYREWRRLCRLAVDLMEPYNEHRIRGYALMNACSSLSRLAAFESGHRRDAMLVEGRTEADASVAYLIAVEDARGIGWARIHKCESLRNAVEITMQDAARLQLISELEVTANQAMASLRLVADQQGLGLASKELGMALLMAYEHSERRSLVKIKRTIGLLEEAILVLSKIGFYRGIGEAYFWLSRALNELWILEKNDLLLIQSIETLLRAWFQRPLVLDSSKSWSR